MEYPLLQWEWNFSTTTLLLFGTSTTLPWLSFSFINQRGNWGSLQEKINEDHVIAIDGRSVLASNVLPGKLPGCKSMGNLVRKVASWLGKSPQPTYFPPIPLHVCHVGQLQSHGPLFKLSLTVSHNSVEKLARTLNCSDMNSLSTLSALK